MNYYENKEPKPLIFGMKEKVALPLKEERDENGEFFQERNTKVLPRFVEAEPWFLPPEVPRKPPKKIPKKAIFIGLGIIFILVFGAYLTQTMVSIANSNKPTAPPFLVTSSNSVVYMPYTVMGNGATPTITQKTVTVAPTAEPKPTDTPQPTNTGNNGDWSIKGSPTVSVDFINKVLAYYGSPASGQGQAFYDLGIQYGIDPVYAIAFFRHESDFGKTGVARYTMSIGNSRSYDDSKVCTNDGCYEKYSSWYQGIAEWYWQMQQYYNGNLYHYLHGVYKDLVTLDEIIPVYAPPSDNNDDSAYICALKNAVASWRKQIILVQNLIC